MGGVLIGTTVSISLFLVLQRLNVNVWSLKQSLLLYPFLLIGFVSQYNYHIIDRIDAVLRGKALLYSILLFVIVALTVPYLGIVDFGSLLMGDIPFLTFVVAIIGSVALLLFSRATQVFKELGKSTIVILGFHHPIMDVVKFCCLKAGVNVFDYSLSVCLSISVATIVLCYFVYLLMNHYTPFLIGKKR